MPPKIPVSAPTSPTFRHRQCPSPPPGYRHPLASTPEAGSFDSKHNDSGYTSRHIRKLIVEQTSFDSCNLCKRLVPSRGYRYTSYISQGFHLFHVSTLSVLKFRIVLLMYPVSPPAALTRRLQSHSAPGDIERSMQPPPPPPPPRTKFKGYIWTRYNCVLSQVPCTDTQYLYFTIEKTRTWPICLNTYW